MFIQLQNILQYGPLADYYQGSNLAQVLLDNVAFHKSP